jgi:hypothetical protein
MPTTSDYRTDTEAALAPAVEGGKKPWRWRWFALIALIILIVGGSAGFLVPYLHTTLSASAATVTVTPTSKHLTSTYTITAVTTKPSAAQKQVGARLLTSTMTKSVTVKATGKGHQDATRATGMLYITSLSGDFPAGWYRVTSNSGVVIMFRVPTSIPARIGSLTVEVQAEPFGPSGNIPAYDIDGQYSVSDVTFYMQNPQPFTGGQDRLNSFALCDQEQREQQYASRQHPKHLRRCLRVAPITAQPLIIHSAFVLHACFTASVCSVEVSPPCGSMIKQVLLLSGRLWNSRRPPSCSTILRQT